MFRTSFSTPAVKAAMIALLLCGGSLRAQTTEPQPDDTKTITTGVPFLLISPDSRAGGMGEANVAIADNASAVFWNPAGLGFQKGIEANFTHANWLPAFNADLFYDNLTGKYYVPNVGTFALGITYLNLGSSLQTDELGREGQTFKSYEFAVTGSYGVRVIPTLALGASLRYINSALSPFGAGAESGTGSASTIAFDIATLWKPKFDGWLGERFSAGLNISNIGPKIAYIDDSQADPLPTNFKLGFALRPLSDDYNKLTVAVDFNKLLVARDANGNTDGVFTAFGSAWGSNGGGLDAITIGIGAEYWYGKPSLLALRAGYFYESPKYGGRRFLTFGAGLRYSLFGVDFSYISTIEQDHPLAGTVRLSLVLNFENAGSKSPTAR